MDMGLGRLQELVMDREAWHCMWFMGSQRVGLDWATELNWMQKYLVINTTKFIDVGFWSQIWNSHVFTVTFSHDLLNIKPIFKILWEILFYSNTRAVALSVSNPCENISSQLPHGMQTLLAVNFHFSTVEIYQNTNQVWIIILLWDKREFCCIVLNVAIRVCSFS